MGKTSTSMVKPIFYMLLVMGPAILFGLQGKQVEMGLGIIASFATASILNIDKIKKFKAGSLEAEMKDALEKAYVTIDEMEKLMRVTVATSMSLLAYEDRLATINESIKKQLVDQLQKIADEHGFGGDATILEMRMEMLCFQSHDQFCEFVESVYSSLEERHKGDAEKIRKALKKMIHDDEMHPTREQIIEVLGEAYADIGIKAKDHLESYLILEQKRANKIIDR